jgi:hypothetical protein
MSIGKLAPWLLIAATFALFLGTPQAFAAPGSISFTAPDFMWQYSNVTGATYIKGNCSFNVMSSTGTGGLFDFSGFYWDTGAVTFGRFGFGCDTLGDTMNVTAMTKLSVTLDCTGTMTGRIWAPDFQDGIVSVTGATYTYDAVNRIVDLTVDVPGNVVITWYAHLTNPATTVSTDVADSARLLASFIPLFIIFLVIRDPKDYKIIIGLGVTCFVIVVLAGVIFGLGF